MNRPNHMLGRAQRGVAALAVSLVMLFAMSLVAFFLSRGLIFEQRTSANQNRSTQAFETAEGGIEWATGMLNDRRMINAACTPTAGQPQEFRDKYVAQVALAASAGAMTRFDLSPSAADARAGCRVNANGAVTCDCPAAGTAPSPVPNTTLPSFTVLFEDEPADTESIRLTSFGCINQTAACGLGATGGGDATARVSVTLKLKPLMRAAPAAALTTGGWAQVCGSFNITNASGVANGNLVNSGGQTQIGNGTYLSGPMPPGAPNCGGGGGQTLATLPGTPIANAIVANDPSLSALANDSNAMFAAFFGSTLDHYKATATTITGNSAVNRANNLITAYNAGYTNFWIDGDIQFSGNQTLGSPQRPVNLVSTSNMSFNGNYNIYGVVYSDSADWNDLGTGTSNIYGAVISRVNYRNNGNGTIVFDPDVLGRTRDAGVMVRVPGTWRDFF